MAEVCNKLEHSVRLIGCSAVEDKLQDRVPETLAYLLEYGALPVAWYVILTRFVSVV